MKGSIVIPVYNEEAYIEKFFINLKQKLTLSSDLEFVFVDDGSSDYSGQIIKRIADSFRNIKVVTLDKNYGRQIAITAGMKQATGDFVVISPITPHNAPAAINTAIEKWKSGSKIVRAVRDVNAKKYKGNFISRFFTNLMRKLFRIQNNILPKATVELYDREVVDVLNSLPAKNMFLRNIDSWIDFEIDEFVYNSGSAQKLKEKRFKKKQEGNNKQRENQKIKTGRPKKKRFYMSSLFVCICLLAVFAGCTVLLALLKMPIILTLFVVLVLITSLIVGVLFGCRAWMIKKIGYLPVIADGKQLYEIKEIYETR